MKAYPESGLRNRDILRQAIRWHRQGLLTDEQLGQIRALYPVSFRETNPFVEIGLFIFTVVAMSGILLLLGTLFDDLLPPSLLGFVSGVATLLILQRLIHRQQFYRSGVDNALILLGIGLISIGWLDVLPDTWPDCLYCLAMFPLLLAAVFYYGDLLMTLGAFLTLVAAVADLVVDLPGGKAMLPFVGMGLSIALYFPARRLADRPGLRYWEDALTLVEWLALGLLLLSTNYFVVQKVNAWLETSPGPAPTTIPLAALFWLLTFIVPLGLLATGLRKRDRPLLIMGGLGLAGALVTWRYYHPVLSPEAYVTVAGLLLLCLSIGLIQWLRQPRMGFTDAPDEDAPTLFRRRPKRWRPYRRPTGRTLRRPEIPVSGVAISGEAGPGQAGKPVRRRLAKGASNCRNRL